MKIFIFLTTILRKTAFLPSKLSVVGKPPLSAFCIFFTVCIMGFVAECSWGQTTTAVTYPNVQVNASTLMSACTGCVKCTSGCYPALQTISAGASASLTFTVKNLSNCNYSGVYAYVASATPNSITSTSPSYTVNAGTTRTLTINPIFSIPGCYHLFVRVTQGDPSCFNSLNAIDWFVNVNPSTPTGVTASTGSSVGRINLSWNSVNSASYYQVLENGNIIANNIASTSKTISGLVQNSYHCYTIRAVYASSNCGPLYSSNSIQRCAYAGACSSPIITNNTYTNLGVSTICINNFLKIGTNGDYIEWYRNGTYIGSGNNITPTLTGTYQPYIYNNNCYSSGVWGDAIIMTNAPTPSVNFTINSSTPSPTAGISTITYSMIMNNVNSFVNYVRREVPNMIQSYISNNNNPLAFIPSFPGSYRNKCTATNCNGASSDIFSPFLKIRPDKNQARPADAQKNTTKELGDPVSPSGSFLFDINLVTVTDVLGSVNLTAHYNAAFPNYIGRVVNFGKGFYGNMDIYVDMSDPFVYKVRMPDGYFEYFVRYHDDTFEAMYQNTECNLVKNADGTLSILFPDGMRYNFRTNGKISTILDRHNNTITFSYNTTSDLLETITLANTRIIRFYYQSGTTLVQKIETPMGVYSTFTYNASNQINTQTAGKNGTAVFSTMQFVYSTTNLLIERVIDARGNTVVRNVFDPQNRVKQQYDAQNRLAYSFVYGSPYGDAVTVYDAKNYYQVLRIDPKGNIYQWQDEETNQHLYGFDNNNNQDRYTNARGFTTTNRLDPLGFSTSTLRPLTTQRDSILYGNFHLPIYYRNEKGNATSVSRNSVGDALSIILPGGYTINQTFDAQGRIISRGNIAHTATEYWTYPSANMVIYTDFAGQIWRVTTDNDGNVVDKEYPDHSHERWQYNYFGQPTEHENQKGDKEYWEYDKNGNNTRYIDFVGTPELYIYDELDNWIKTIYAHNLAESCGRNEKNEIITYTDINGDSYQFTYYKNGWGKTVTTPRGTYAITRDAEGNQTSVADPLGNTDITQFDARDRAVLQTPPVALGLASVSASYDPNDNIVKTSLLTSTQIDKTYTLSNLDDVKKITDGENLQNDLELDGNLQLKKITNSRTNPTTIVRNTIGRPTSANINGHNLYGGVTYTPNGLISHYNDGNALGFDILRDAVGNDTSIICSNGRSKKYKYNKNNNLSQSVTDDGYFHHFLRDSLDRTIGEQTNFGDIQFAYIKNQLTQMIYPNTNNVVNYEFSGGLPVRIKINGILFMTITYDANGISTGNIYNNGSKMIYKNIGGRVYSQILYDANNAVVFSDSLVFDQQGNPSRIQVVAAMPAPYLPTGNVYAGTYNDREEQTSYNGLTITHNANGDVTTSGTNTYTLRENSMMTGFTHQGSTANNLKYNAFGTWVEGDLDGLHHQNIISYTLGDVPHIVQENKGGTRTDYVYLGNTPLAAITNGNVETLHFDILGHATATTNSSGTVTTRYNIDPHGTYSVKQGNSTQPFLYNGAYGAPTLAPKLVYEWARVLDVEKQRFLSRDPYPLNVDFSNGLNPYIYANNNPLRYVDYNGMKPNNIIKPNNDKIVNVDEINRVISKSKGNEMIQLPEKGYGFQRYTNNINDIYTYNGERQAWGDNWITKEAALDFAKMVDEMKINPITKDVTIHYGDINSKEAVDDLGHTTHFRGNALDIHYIGENGEELIGENAYKNASVKIMNEVFDIAKKHGFTENYSYGKRFDHDGNNNQDVHKNHFHLGQGKNRNIYIK